jgi:hypothetical protein
LRVWFKRNCVKGGKTHTDVQAPRQGTDTCNHLTKESCAILEAAAVVSRTGVRTQELVPEIAVAVFNIHEIETRLMGHSSRAMEVLNDLPDFSVCKQRVIVSDAKSLV